MKDIVRKVKEKIDYEKESWRLAGEDLREKQREAEEKK